MRTIGKWTILVFAATLSACSSPETTTPQPRIEATLTTAADNKDPNAESLGDLVELAKNRAKLSCIELTLGSLRASGMSAIADSRLVKADDTTRLVAGTLGDSTGKLIKAEMECHCDAGQPMPGFEKWERRTLLLSGRNKRLNPNFISLYPKDQNGNPRFLKMGEALPDATLSALPAVAVQPRFDDCDRSCKAARGRINAAALSEGKPEPYPALELPRKAQCTPAAG